MGTRPVRFVIQPYQKPHAPLVRSQSKYRNIIAIKATDSTWSERMTFCLDPILNKNFGCFNPENPQKITCLSNVLPQVLGCLYFGKKGTKYCIPEVPDQELSCEGKCGYSQFEMEKLFGCINTGGKASSDCNTYNSEFCNCSSVGKVWNSVENKCQCPEGKNDYGGCCSETICRGEYQEQFSCATGKCECDSGYSRMPVVPSTHPNAAFNGQCIKVCEIGSSQNNEINFNNPRIGQPGCNPAIGENGDTCCASDKMCVLDNGGWDGQQTEKTKSECLAQNGIWRITNNTTCPRLGHCEFPLCNWQTTSIPPPVQILDSFETDGPAWALRCEKCSTPISSPPPYVCEKACQNFCSTHPTYNKYEKSHCSGGTDQACICHCNP